jgi:hypothetical protein
MVAKINREMFTGELFTPPSDPSDSEEVLLALDAARALEARGDIRGAVRCLRRAADESELQGNDPRVLVLARAAADLTATVGPVSLAPSESAPPSETTAIPPMLAALMSSVPLSAPRSSAPPRAVAPAPAAEVPTDASSAPAMSPPPSDASPPPAAPSPAADKPVTERTMRIGSIRVAIGGSIDESSFVVYRLAPGQPLPAGATEAIVVLTGDVEGRVEIETHLRVTGAPTK